MRSYSAQKTIPTRTRSKAVQVVVSVEAPTARFDSQGCQVDARLRPRVEEAGLFSSTSLLQLPAVERLPRAKNEIWNLGSQTPCGGRRARRASNPVRFSAAIRNERVGFPNDTDDLLQLVEHARPNDASGITGTLTNIQPSPASASFSASL